MKSIDGDIEGVLSSLFEEIDRLKSEVSRLARLVEEKDAEIADLKGRLAKYEKPPKDSGNSSVPPDQGQHGKAGDTTHQLAAQADRQEERRSART